MEDPVFRDTPLDVWRRQHEQDLVFIKYGTQVGMLITLAGLLGFLLEFLGIPVWLPIALTVLGVFVMGWPARLQNKLDSHKPNFNMPLSERDRAQLTLWIEAVAGPEGHAWVAREYSSLIYPMVPDLLKDVRNTVARGDLVRKAADHQVAG